MNVRETVFGSRPEHRLFKSLDSAWPNRISLYPSLPFLNLIRIQRAELSETEWNFVKSTSVDFTACAKQTGRPLVSVEFDGIGSGYSQSGRYIEEAQGPDPNRRSKLDLKVRLAQKARYPFFVVSYEEAQPVAEEDQLTVTHAIIGQCLVHQHLTPLLNDRLEAFDESLYPPWEHDEILQDMVIDAETELELQWNPLASAAAKASYEAQRTGLVQSKRPQ